MQGPTQNPRALCLSPDSRTASSSICRSTGASTWETCFPSTACTGHCEGDGESEDPLSWGDTSLGSDSVFPARRHQRVSRPRRAAGRGERRPGLPRFRECREGTHRWGETGHETSLIRERGRRACSPLRAARRALTARCPRRARALLGRESTAQPPVGRLPRSPREAGSDRLARGPLLPNFAGQSSAAGRRFAPSLRSLRRGYRALPSRRPDGSSPPRGPDVATSGEDSESGARPAISECRCVRQVSPGVCSVPMLT